jgi:hypothetical protein
MWCGLPRRDIINEMCRKQAGRYPGELIANLLPLC